MPVTRYGKHVLDCVRSLPRRLASSRMLTVRGLAVAAWTPQTVDLTAFFPDPVYDQGQEGACTAHMAVGLAVYRRAVENLPYVMLSRAMEYWDARQIEGSTATDSGASIADTFQSMQSKGICPESMWPYIPPNLTLQPASECYTAGLENLALASAQVSQDAPSLFACLANNMPVGIGVACYDSFDTAANAATGIVPMPDTSSESLEGGHAIIICGLVELNGKWCWKFRNSWSAAWGDNGYGYLPFEFVLDPDLAYDFHVLTRIGPAAGAPALGRMGAVAPNGVVALVVGGFTESVNDGSAIWTIADRIEALGCTVTRRAWDQVSPSDLASARIVVNYSWGKAATWRAMAQLADKPQFHEFTIAGVPCLFFGQLDLFGNTFWQEPANVLSCTNYQVDSFPVSRPIENPSAIYVNVSCDGPGVNHQTIPGLASVQDGIVRGVETLIAVSEGD